MIQTSAYTGETRVLTAPEQSHVSGGFFWHQAEPSLKIMTHDPFLIAHCVMWTRPRPWQLIAWYRAFRLWLSLPYTYHESNREAFATVLRQLHWRYRRWLTIRKHGRISARRSW